MRRVREKNVKVYDRDVKTLGTYVYTSTDRFSSQLARKKETEEIIKLIKLFFRKKIAVVDVGSGDGTFALQFFKLMKPSYLFGFDFSKQGVDAANKRVPKIFRKRIAFKQLDIYQVDKFIKKNEFDLVIISGVLHHLYRPKDAIKKISNICDHVIVLEANGYSPLLKIIEKISPYHIQHEEKSYWPPTLNTWFRKHGYQVKRQTYFGIVPYFCPDIIAKFLQRIEPIIENIPYINRFFCRTNLIYYSR